MNETESFLLHKRSTLSKSIPTGFIIHLIGTMIAFGITFAIYSLFQNGTRYQVTTPLVFEDLTDCIYSLCLSQTGDTVALLILFISGFAVGARGVSFLLCLWRGISFGCVVSLLSSGLLIGYAETWYAGLLLSFLATILFILLSSYVSVYSDCILRTYSTRKRRYTSSLTREYCLCFLILSGSILSVGIVSFLFM